MITEGQVRDEAKKLWNKYDADQSGFMEPLEYRKAMTEISDLVGMFFEGAEKHWDQKPLQKALEVLNDLEGPNMKKEEYNRGVENFIKLAFH